MIPVIAAGRGVLKRMHNFVLSEETEKIGTGGDTSMSNLSPTILPKRVQVTLPPGERSGSGGEREVIGAGLPLIQRLRLLKQKEDKVREKKVEEEQPVLLSKKSLSSVDKLQIIIPESSPPSLLMEKSLFQTKVSIEPPPPSKTNEKQIRRGTPQSLLCKDFQFAWTWTWTTKYAIASFSLFLKLRENGVAALLRFNSLG